MAKTAKKDTAAKTKKGGKKKARKTVDTATIADELGIETKTLRVWLRSEDLGVGRGKRYKFTEKQAEEIVARYEAEHDDESDDDEDESED